MQTLTVRWRTECANRVRRVRFMSQIVQMWLREPPARHCGTRETSDRFGHRPFLLAAV